MYSGYGQWIIQRIAELPSTSRVVAIIRHSERPDFHGIPTEQWNNILLTENGVRYAVEFGSALVEEANIMSVRAEGWGLERCQLTAEKIKEGANLAGSKDSSYSTVNNLQSPILDLELYRNYLKNGKYMYMVRDWFQGGPLGNAMKPFGPYSNQIISRILNEHMPYQHNASIIVTHDLYILPLLNHVFNTKHTEVDFMDGILIAEIGEKVKIFTHNSEKTMGADEFSQF